MRNLIKNLLKVRRALLISLKSSIGALQESHDVLQKTHKDLEVQFNALWSSSSSNPSSDPDRTKASTSNGCDR
jgi:hypothetical protein